MTTSIWADIEDKTGSRADPFVFRLSEVGSATRRGNNIVFQGKTKEIRHELARVIAEELDRQKSHTMANIVRHGIENLNFIPDRTRNLLYVTLKVVEQAKGDEPEEEEFEEEVVEEEEDPVEFEGEEEDFPVEEEEEDVSREGKVDIRLTPEELDSARSIAGPEVLDRLSNFAKEPGALAEILYNNPEIIDEVEREIARLALLPVSEGGLSAEQVSQYSNVLADIRSRKGKRSISFRQKIGVVPMIRKIPVMSYR